MGIAWDRDSKSYQRIKNRYKNKRLEAFTTINAEHNLCLPQVWLEAEAEAYGRVKADSEVFLFSELDPISMAFITVGAILTAVITIIAPPAGWLGWTLWGVALGGQVGISVLTITQQGFLDQVAYSLQAQALNTTTQANLTKNTLEARSNQLSDFLIYNPYAICADGEVYKAGQAGGESFNYTKAYNPAQGLLGEYALSPIDELTQNRSHKHLAGNDAYTTAQNPLPIPRKKAELAFESVQGGIKASIQTRLDQINEGYMKLSKEYFGYLDSGKHIEKYYKHSQDKRIEPLKNRYKQNDFLHKLGNYSKGKRADFFYEYLKEHKLSPEQRQKMLQEVLEYYKGKLESTSTPLAKGAIFLELSLSFVESFYTDLGELGGLEFAGNYDDGSAIFSQFSEADRYFHNPYTSTFFLSGKTLGLQPPTWGELDKGHLHATRSIQFANEAFVQGKLKLDFYTLGWREILHEFDEIYNHIAKDGENYYFATHKRAKAWWIIINIFGLKFYDDDIFDYITPYTLDTGTINVFLALLERKPDLSEQEWEQAYQLYTGAMSEST